MNVLLLNGSPNQHGCTYTALSEVKKTLEESGVTTDLLWIGKKAVQGCIACNRCEDLDRCVFQDALYNAAVEKLAAADGFIVGSPVYYGGANGSLTALLARLFYSKGELLAGKPAAAVVSCRRGGATAAFQQLNQFFYLMQMPVVSSQYWNDVHGNTPEEVRQDLEGMQTMRVLGRNMAWMLQTVKTSRIPAPVQEDRIFTNFVR